jgi:hypothetical protein
VLELAGLRTRLVVVFKLRFASFMKPSFSREKSLMFTVSGFVSISGKKEKLPVHSIITKVAYFGTPSGTHESRVHAT